MMSIARGVVLFFFFNFCVGLKWSIINVFKLSLEKSASLLGCGRSGRDVYHKQFLKWRTKKEMKRGKCF